MSDNPQQPADGPDIPTFEELAADPEIAPLLDFDPVPRKVKRPDGWTPELQQELIARIAAAGTLQAAVWQMGKHATGAEALYKVACADGFRASWDAALEIGRRRNGLDCPPPFAGEVPGITRRARRAASRPSGIIDAEWQPADEDADMPDAEKLALIERLAHKFLRKVVAEREARLAGELVAADFYLRQVTALEVMFDVLADGGGMSSWDLLRKAQRGGHSLIEIADTPFARLLDAKRREYWAANGEPMRPDTHREDYLQDHGDHRTEPSHAALGATSVPARGYSPEQWAALDYEAQVAARRKQFEQDAAEQIAWEATARREHESRRGAPREHGQEPG